MKQIILVTGLFCGLSQVTVVKRILDSTKNEDDFDIKLIVNVDGQFDCKKVVYNSNEVLEKTLMALKEWHCNLENSIVLYEGINTELLKDNLPCKSLDLCLLRNKLKEVVGGDDTPQQLELLGRMFTGAILELIREDSDISKTVN